MKRITLLVVLFSFCFVFAAMSQTKNLAELAKQEKARREALEKSGKKVKVLTNDDIEKLKSQLAIESGSSETAAENASSADSTYTPPQEGADYVPDPQPIAPPVDQNAERQKQIREMEEQKEQAEKDAAEARATVGEGGLYHSRNTGDQYKKAREAEDKADQLDKKIEDKTSKQPQPQVYTPPPPEPTYEEPQEEEPQEEEPPL